MIQEKTLTIAACLLTKLEQHGNFTRAFLEVTVSVVKDRKLRTALRTNQRARFVSMSYWEKLKFPISPPTFNIPYL